MKLTFSAKAAADNSSKIFFWLEAIPVIKFITFIIFIALLVLAAVTDIKKRTIPNLFPLAMLIPAALSIASGRTTLLNAIGGLLAAGVPLLVMAMLKRESIGGGDIKLSGAAGLVLGPGGALFMLSAASLFLLCTFAVLKLLGKLESGGSMPFAPFIAAGGIMAFNLIILGG